MAIAKHKSGALVKFSTAIRLFSVNLMRMTFAKFTRERREAAIFAGSPGLGKNTVYENEVPFLLSIDECSCPSSNNGSVDVLHLRPHFPPPQKGFCYVQKLLHHSMNVTWQSTVNMICN